MTEADLFQALRLRRPVRMALSAAGAVAGLLMLAAAAVGAVPHDAAGKVDAATRLAAPPNSTPAETVPPSAEPAPSRPAPGTLTVRSTGDAGEMALTLARPAPAAAFPYGGYLWVVVATTEAVTRSSSGPSGAGLFAGLEIVRLKDAVALRLPRRAGYRLRARRDRATWTFVYASAPRNGTATPLAPRLVSATLDTTVVSVDDRRLATVHRLVDPTVGATLIVATSLEPGIALRSAYRTAAFRLLPTRLGLAVEVRADGVGVERQESGIRVVYRRPAARPARR